ncbi:MAG: chromate efflux transporter [Acidobacteria bacterium]|nr:chromate efflux transporter [Acidobacteriota bacterium]MCA1641319.1 chromate efflux transporter [Acidobacteriota bacterium]
MEAPVPGQPIKQMKMQDPRAAETSPDEDDRMPAWREVFLYFLMLGFVNVGGPVAQITMMFNHMVERRRWLSKDRFVKIMGFCHMLPGPEALQLAIYVGYLKRGVGGGVLAGLTFIVPGAAIMILLSWLYVTYGSLPQVNDALFILKPAVLGIIAAGIIKLGRASIKTPLLAALLAGSIVGMRFLGVNFLVILLAAGLLHLLLKEGSPRLRRPPAAAHALFGGLGLGFALTDSRWFQMAWLFLKTGLFSFGGAYASLIFLQRGAVDQHHWLTAGQLLDGVALSVATPGPFMLFTTFAGYLAGGVPGAIIATFFVFLPSFVFVLAGARYIEQVRNNRAVQAFLAGASAAVVGVIFVVSLALAPEALVSWVSVCIAVSAFLIITLLKRDVALVAAGAMLGGVIYAAARALA